MVQEQTTIGLSREFIIHPGETLQEALEELEMSQKELSVRTGVSDKHISTIINGSKPISVAFARKLEYALGIDSRFWINLQANYDSELLEFEEINNISEEEIGIIKKLKDVIEYFGKHGWINTDDTPVMQVLDMRKIMNVSNLTSIQDLAFGAAFRAQIKNNKVDPYVLFAWQRMCELLTDNIEISEELDIEELKRRIPEIKNLMFADAKKIQSELPKIFAECGIAFRIVKNFRGAPVQGFIKRTDGGRTVLCMTIRQSFADIFWFTLFHEIAHIINGDGKNRFVDFASVSSDSENKADKFAKDVLIPTDRFKWFVNRRNFTLDSIKSFANQCGIPHYIVIGRLMKEGILDWSAYSGERLKFQWVELLIF